jgi:uncharacterized protein (TIGR00369 family)
VQDPSVQNQSAQDPSVPDPSVPDPSVPDLTAPDGPARHTARAAPDPAMESPGDGARRRTYQWGDPAVSAAAVRELDGMTFFREIIAGRLPSPPIAATLGFNWVSVEPGNVVFEITPAEFHYNPIGSVHGGVYATVCDSACACAVHSTLPAGAYYTSLDLTIKFIRPVTADSGRLRLLCEGTVTHLGSRTALAQAQLTGPGGKLYAHATSSCLIFRPGE